MEQAAFEADAVLERQLLGGVDQFLCGEHRERRHGGDLRGEGHGAVEQFGSRHHARDEEEGKLFKILRKELDSDKEQEELFENMTDPTRPVYEMDGYGQEALDISIDYLDLLGGNKVAVGRQQRTIAQ